MADSRLFLTDEGLAAVERGKHDGNVLVSAIDEKGRVSPLPLNMLADRVTQENDVPGWAVKGAGVAVADVPEKVKLVLEQATRAIKQVNGDRALSAEQEMARSARSEEVPAIEVELATGDVLAGRTVGTDRVSMTLQAIVGAGSGCGVVLAMVGLGALASVSSDAAIVSRAIPWVVGSWVFAHLAWGVNAVWQSIKFWQPVLSKKTKKSPGGLYQFRVHPTYGTQIRARKAGHESWRAAEEFAVVSLGDVGKEVKVKASDTADA